MADIINLRRFKKDRARTEKAEQADVNRVKFGQTKAEKQVREAEKTLSNRTLDGHKRSDD
jgi:Domain of unknown function (DUF4169)